MISQFTLNVGIGTVGVTSIFFGLLDKIENGKVFLGLSFALRQGNTGAKNVGGCVTFLLLLSRIIEACGNSGFLTGR